MIKLSEKDMVVLKRNDVNDATHTDQDNWKWYIGEDSYVWGAGNSEQIQRWDKASLDHVDLKPIGDKQMTSHNIEQQAFNGINFSDEHMLKIKPRLYLDPTQNYAEIEWDGTTLKRDDWIEVPYYMNFAHLDSSGFYFTVKKDEGIPVVWQRTQDEPFLTPESVVEREVNHKNVVKKTNEFSERLKMVEREVKRLAEIKTEIIPNNHLSVFDTFKKLNASLMGVNSRKPVKIKPIEISGTIEPKPDLSPQEDALVGVDATLAERQSQYGSFEDVAAVTQDLLSVLKRTGYNSLPKPHKEALHMICSKMARLVNGDFNSIDGWHDIGGYAKLIEDIARNETK